MVLIAVSAVATVTVSLVRLPDLIRAGGSRRLRLGIVVGGHVALGGVRADPSGTADAALPVTGAVLAAIGAIVMIAVGFYL